MTKKKVKKPAIVLLTLDSINRGVLPSKMTLEAIFDELEDKEHFLEVAVALLGAKSEPVAAPKNENNSQPKVDQKQAIQRPVMAPKIDKPKLNPEAVVSSTAMLESGRMSIINKKN